MKMPKIKAIIGLGNPGEEYEKTYHNAGIMLCEHILKEFPNSRLAENDSFTANTAEIDGKEFFVIKINSFMNNSGPAVLKAMKALNISKEEIALAHDDSDFELGKYRFSPSSRSAGHRGVESVISSLGSQDFLRIRIGIRKKTGKALDFVLKKIAKGDLITLEDSFKNITEELRRGFI